MSRASQLAVSERQRGEKMGLKTIFTALTHSYSNCIPSGGRDWAMQLQHPRLKLCNSSDKCCRVRAFCDNSLFSPSRLSNPINGINPFSLQCLQLKFQGQSSGWGSTFLFILLTPHQQILCSQWQRLLPAPIAQRNGKRKATIMKMSKPFPARRFI